jgi:hypothetical protein
VAGGFFPLTELDARSAGCGHCEFRDICRIAELGERALERSVTEEDVPYRPRRDDA